MRADGYFGPSIFMPKGIDPPVPNQMWEEGISQMQAQLALVLIEGDKSVVPDGVRDYFKTIQAQDWGNNRNVVSYGRMDAARIIPLCREGIVPWWMPLTGKAVLGQLDELKKIEDAMAADIGNGSNANYSSIMTWLCHPAHLTNEGYKNTANANVIQHVLQQGADVNMNNGSWLKYALKELPGDCLAHFIAHGASPAPVQAAMGELAAQKQTEQLAVVQNAVAGKTLHAKVDDTTLMDVKFIPEGNGLVLFRSIFNFHARRVNEVFENGAAVAMSNAPFSEYAPEAIRFAAEKLEKLGGNTLGTMDKPRRTQLTPNSRA